MSPARAWRSCASTTRTFCGSGASSSGRRSIRGAAALQRAAVRLAGGAAGVDRGRTRTREGGHGQKRTRTDKHGLARTGDGRAFDSDVRVCPCRSVFVRVPPSHFRPARGQRGALSSQPLLSLAQSSGGVAGDRLRTGGWLHGAALPGARPSSPLILNRAACRSTRSSARGSARRPGAPGRGGSSPRWRCPRPPRSSPTPAAARRPP